MLVDTYCSLWEVKIIYWMKNQRRTCTFRTLNTFIHSYNCWTPYGLQIWTVVEYNMEIINPISKHSKHNQVCLFFVWEYEDVHRTNCDMDIKFENECKVSLVFHYVVKSEKYVLLYWRAGNSEPPGILHFVWRTWTRSFRIIWYWDRCLYTTRTCIKTTITGNCGCFL